MGLNVILGKIKEYDRIIIYGHIRPDGDCYGAQIGLKDIVKSSFPNKKVYAVGETSEYVSFVGDIDVIDEKEYEGALSIVVDTATRDRISDQRYSLGKEVIKIDHHIPIDQYGDIIWVDTDFPSCAQMIAYFYQKYENELRLSEKGAIALYTGIVTDTGRFKYRGVDELTHRLAGMLITKGANPEEIDLQLSKVTLNEVNLKGFILSTFEISEHGFIYFRMTRKIINEYKVSDEDAAAMVSILGDIEGHPVWALIIEYPDEIRIRLRSNGPDIDDIANLFEGGGHAKAAGGKLDNWRDLSRLIKIVDARIIEWRQSQ